MPRPEVVLGEKSRAGMLRGFESMARLLAITLGPIGGNIANAREPKGQPELLTDAATIARRILSFPDSVETAGAMLMRHMAWRARQEVGDGSATTAVLAMAIAKEVQRIVTAGANAMMVKRGVERATDAALRALDELSVPLEGEERIAAVATAAMGDADIGKVLGELYDVLGPNAQITIEPYIATYHDRAYHEGTRFKGGYVSPYLLTDPSRRVAVLDDAMIVAGDLNFESVQSVQNVLELAVKAQAKSVFFNCRSMSDKAIGVLVANNERGIVRSCAATMKPIGDARRGTFEDIALLTGGQPLTDKSGITAENVTAADLGRADRVLVAQEYYLIVGGKGDKRAIRDRVQKLRQRLRETHDSDERETLRELVTHFTAGVGELRIGGLTEQERKARSEVAEQGMKSVASAMESGIVPGGGAAYVACIPAVLAAAKEAEGDEALGAQVMARALEEPMRRIAANAGLHPPSAIAEAQRGGAGWGIDVRQKKAVNMVEAGIVDPTAVTKRALQLAASGAMMLLTTDALVLSRKPKENFEP